MLLHHVGPVAYHASSPACCSCTKEYREGGSLWDDKEILSKADNFRPFPYVLRMMAKVRRAGCISCSLPAFCVAPACVRSPVNAELCAESLQSLLHSPQLPTSCRPLPGLPMSSTLGFVVTLACAVLQFGKASTPSGEWQH